MVYVLIRQQLARYADFEEVFKQDAKRRARLGSKGGTVFRDTGDPQMIFILLEWDDIAKARAFADAYETHEAMEWATSGPEERWVWVIENNLHVEA